jgi:hypothetical protein
MRFSFRRVYSVALLSNKHEKSNSHSLRRCERQKTLQYIFEHWITQNWVLANKGNSLLMAILFIISINSSCVISYTAAKSNVMWPKIVWNTQDMSRKLSFKTGYISKCELLFRPAPSRRTVTKLCPFQRLSDIHKLNAVFKDLYFVIEIYDC